MPARERVDVLGRALRTCVGPDVRRSWLLDLELWFYLLPVGIGLLVASRADDAEALAARATTAPYWVEIAAGAAVVGLTLARWWRPDRAGALAAGAVVLADAFGLVSAIGFGRLSSIGLTLASGAATVALAAVVRHTRPALCVPVVLLSLARLVHGVVTTDWYDPGPDRFGGGRTLLVSVVLIIVVMVATGWLLPLVVGLVLRGLDARRRAAELARVRAAERMLLARELHDLVANHVTGIITYAQAAGLRSDVPDGLRGMLGAIETAGDHALAGMHRMVGALRSVDARAGRGPSGGLGSFDVMPTTATDLRGAVRSAVGDDDGPVRTVTRLAPELESSSLAAPADVLATVHRLVLEAMTNVRRHAPHADEVAVTLELPRPDVLRVEVRNDGAGRTVRVSRRQGGYGLVGLRERVAALGGTLQHGRWGDDHWILRADLPWRADA